jgi:pyruvate dehydrogenase E2 component (dihydrolipoamide acetyltransferase)
MRATIARRMVQSLQTTAQLTLVTDADVTDLEERREALKAQGALSFTEILIKPVSQALRQHPLLNALLENDIVTPSETIDIGIAVQTDSGLVVPVLRGADPLSVRETGQRFRPLAASAKNGTIAGSDLSGGSFSITNLGAYGIDAFTPILNAPQVAILGVGRIAERFVREGSDGTWRKFVTLSLTFDHRAVDGAPAAQFLQTLIAALAAPAAWLED